MYHDLKRTARAIVFAHYTYCFAALSLPSSLLKLPFIRVRSLVGRSLGA